MRQVFPGIWEADPVQGFGGVIAHQGGWDEALVVVVPVAILAVLIAVSIRRADQRDRDSNGPTGAP